MDEESLRLSPARGLEVLYNLVPGIFELWASSSESARLPG